jgi:hemolysin activation/secretion protein
MAKRLGGVLGGIMVVMGMIASAGVADGWGASDVPLRPVVPDHAALPAMAQQQPHADPLPKNGSSASPRAAESAAPSTEAAEPVERQGFAIRDFVVEGSTLLSRDKIEETLAKYKGPGRTIADIDKARLDLERAYQQLGYPTVLVVVPEQTVEEGTVRLNVVEGRLLSIAVTGNKYFSRYNILGKLPSVKIGALLYEPEFVKQLDMVNANPDLKVAPVLKPSSESGMVDLELKAKERMPLHAKMTGDNKGAITTPADRITLEAQYANLWDADHILTLQTSQTPTDLGAVQSYGFSYVAPLKWPDHLLAIYASKVISNSVLAGTSLPISGGGNISVAGNATIAGLRFLFPIFKGGQAVHQLSLGLDYKRLEPTDAEFPGGLGSIVVLGPIQYLPASIGYSGTYPDPYGMTSFTTSFLGYVAGTIPGGSEEDFSGNGTDEDPGQRQGSTGTFGVVRGNISRMQPLPQGFVFSGKVEGQWGTQPLIPAEQYFAGGLDTVRGYIQNEALGDNALAWRAELYTPELPSIPLDRFWQRRRSSDLKATFKFVAFYDYAKLWIQQAPANQADHLLLKGAGGGLRMKVEPINLNLQFDQGVALHDGTATKKGDTFAHFLVSIGF